MLEISDHDYTRALELLREALTIAHTNTDFRSMVTAKDGVFQRFRPQFTRDFATQIREEDVRAFLQIETNQHWSGLHRQSSRICSDMQQLREVLTVLFDDAKPLAERVDTTVNKIPGIGKAIMSAMLLVAFPDKCGVWNGTSEYGLKKYGLWPRFDRGTTLGNRYVVINEILVRLARDLDVDLWELDGLWWFYPDSEPGDQSGESPDAIADKTVGEHKFALEAHLQRFLWNNWEFTELSAEWDRYTEHGDPEIGCEYPCDAGRIDILARHKTQPRWLVIELKRGKTADTTVGQILRYMGWVKRHLTNDEESVEGLIICYKTDPKLLYALEMIPNVSVREYQVEFRLVEVLNGN